MEKSFFSFIRIKSAMSRLKHASPEKYIPSIRDIKVSLFSEYQWISLLPNRGKPYNHIIDGLINIGKYWNSDDSESDNGAFTMKWMAEKLHESPAHVSKWIRAIYEDLFELNCSEPELFVDDGEILCEFWFSGFQEERYCSFSFGLPALPHVGDTLDFCFVRAAIGCDFFYIKDIRHYRQGRKTCIEIDCEAGTKYNKFREFLLDKAQFMNEIGFMTEHNARPYLDDMLRAYEKKGYVPSVETIIREREERWKRWEESRKS